MASREITFTVPGRPAPFVRATGKQYRYQGNAAIGRYMDYKTSVGDYASLVCREMFEGWVDIEMIVYLRRPKTRRWDSMNVAKAIEDGMTGVVYPDDKWVRDATIRVRTAGLNDEAVWLYACREWSVIHVAAVDEETW